MTTYNPQYDESVYVAIAAYREYLHAPFAGRKEGCLLRRVPSVQMHAAWILLP
jgi:hypothetical protein